MYEVEWMRLCTAKRPVTAACIITEHCSHQPRQRESYAIQNPRPGHLEPHTRNGRQRVHTGLCAVLWHGACNDENWSRHELTAWQSGIAFAVSLPDLDSY